MDIKRNQDQLLSVRELFPIQRQILSDLVRGAQVVRCQDGTFRACIEIAGRAMISAYALNSSAMTRLCVVVWQIDTAFCSVEPGKPADESSATNYLFHYIPAMRRAEVSDLLTLTIKPPKEAFEVAPKTETSGKSSAQDDRDVVVAIPRSRPIAQ